MGLWPEGREVSKGEQKRTGREEKESWVTIPDGQSVKKKGALKAKVHAGN